jgi:glycerophosphoryl diester phosphodiesterase
MPLNRYFFTSTFRSAWRSVVLLWKPMAGWTLIVYAMFTALMAPVFVSMVHWGVFRGDRSFVGNEELIGWLLSPAGFSYLFLILLITLSGTLIRYAGLFQIISDDLHGRRITLTGTAFRIFRRFFIIVKLCAITILCAIILLIPLGAGIGLIYHHFLAEFDINYYISAAPPEWYQALIWGGAWLMVWGISITLLIGFTLPALPAYLDGKRSLRDSLKKAWSLPMAKILQFLISIAVAVFFWILIRIAVDASLLFLFTHFAGWVTSITDSLRVLATAAGGYLALSFIFSVLISFIGFSLISAILTKFYYIYSRGHEAVVTPGMLHLTQKTARTLYRFLHPKKVSLLLIALVSGSIVSSIALTRYMSTEADRAEVVSHRANAGGAPENSLAALQKSIDLGIEYAEIDVQLTSDGTAIILHDADFMRVAGDPRTVAGTPYADLAGLQLISDRHFADSLLIIPTLDDFLEMANGQIGLMVELKYYGFDPDLAVETIRKIQNHGMEDQVLLISLSAEAIRQLQEIAPDIPRGYVSAVAAGDPGRLPIDFLAINQQSVTRELVHEFRQQHRQIYAWTVNRQDEMVAMLEKGVSGLITDETELAVDVVNEFSGLTGAERLLLRFGFTVMELGGVVSEDADRDQPESAARY